MILRNKIVISAGPHSVWEIITDPRQMMQWNPRVVAVVPVSTGRPRPNAQYRIRYRLASKESNFLAEILEFEEDRRFALHFSGGNLPVRGYIQEIYDLAPAESGTLLRQSIMIEQCGMGPFRGLALRLKNLAGAVSARRYLRQLKELAEQKA